MALSGEHYAANMLDHRFLGRNLGNAQKKEAYEYITAADKNFTSFIMALVAKTLPFPEYMFGAQFVMTSPLLWWRSMILENEKDWPDKEKFLTFCEKLLTATAATAGLERQFSTFGLVQSKLRNRLGNEKAAKLVFLFKYFNQNPENRKNDLTWITSPVPQSELPSTSTPTIISVENDSDEEDNIPLSNLTKT